MKKFYVPHAAYSYDEQEDTLMGNASYSDLWVQGDWAGQILARALGYPWYKDDQVNFPGATQNDGANIKGATLVSLATEAAKRIEKLEAQLECLAAYLPTEEGRFTFPDGEYIETPKSA